MIRIYQSQGTPISSDGSLSNPVKVNIDTRKPDPLIKQLFIRNDESNKYYEDITISITDTDNITNEETKLWKMIRSDTQPTQDDWDEVDPANSIEMLNIGTSSASNTSTYFSFWIYVEFPQNSPIDTFTGVKLVVTSREDLIV